MADKQTNFFDAIPIIFHDISSGERLPIIVICGLFLIIGRYISAASKTHNDLRLSIEEVKAEIISELKDTRIFLVRLMYELHLKDNRRKHKQIVDEDRRR